MIVIKEIKFNRNGTVTVAEVYFHDLLEDSKFLYALRAAGVDNWDGYDYVLNLLNDKENA